MKLQRYDFSGWDRRSARYRGSNPARRRTLLVRIGGIAAFILVMMGVKKITGPENAATVTAGEKAGGNRIALAGSTGLGAAAAPPSAPAAGLDLATAALDYHSPFRNYPSPDTFEVAGRTLAVQYAADSLLHARIQVYLNRYRPDHAVVLACDLRSGAMLGVGERSDSTVIGAPRLAFRSGFPAASLAKILTATAALELEGKGPDDSIPQIGSYHTLYRRQLKVRPGDHNKVTLAEAFSKSVNPAFGVLGLAMGHTALEKTALRMGFNRELACVRPSVFPPADTGYGLAEISCGFTRRTTISPIHALAIARGTGDDGRARLGPFARSLVDLSARREVELLHDEGTAFVSGANLPKLQALMESTVRRGTARKGFHQVMRASHLQKIEVGGKTGSLDGEEPSWEASVVADDEAREVGRYDWFIGYARLKEDPARGIALSVMLVHKEYAQVRSTVLAALLVRDWLAAEEKARRMEARIPTAVTGDAAEPRKRDSGSTRDS
jgi:hypothetical protein